MTLWFVLGTAAELIKVYPLIRACEARGWQWRVISTGQSGQNFWMQYDDFGLPREKAVVPFVSQTDLRTSAQALTWFMRAIFSLPTRWLAKSSVSQQWLVVHGDTLSTLVGAWWGFRLGVKVAHVEAGLRSKNWWQPFPEEVCRRLVSRLSSLHFVPDDRAAKNLELAKVGGKTINTNGNSLLDAIRWIVFEAKVTLSSRPICVANLHRFENLNSAKRWQVIVETLLKIARTHQLIMVMHPQTEHRLNNSPIDKKKLIDAGVELRPRLTFSKFIELVHQSDFLISDGGSNQEECYYLGKPCLLMRSTTERQEGLGETALLSFFEPTKIDEFLSQISRYRREPLVSNNSPTEVMMNSFAESTLG